MKIGILSKRETGFAEKMQSYYEEKGFEVTIYTSRNLTVNKMLLENDFYILKSKQLLFLYAGYFLKANNIPVIPDPSISYKHKHRIESYYSIRNAGLNTPDIYLGTPKTIKSQFKQLDYPFIVKPLMGSSSEGIRIIKNSADFDSDENKILYVERFIDGIHYLSYFIDKHICVGKKQPLKNEHSEVKIVPPDEDIKQALIKWRDKYNLLFGHLDMIREYKTNNLIVVDSGTFPEFTNWKIIIDPVSTICNLILERYREMANIV